MSERPFLDINEIAANTGIDEKYIEQILADLPTMPDIAKYCKECGNKSVIKTEDNRLCNNCGVEYSDSAAFSYLVFSVTSFNALHADHNLGSRPFSEQEWNQTMDRNERNDRNQRVNRPYGIRGTKKWWDVNGIKGNWDKDTPYGKAQDILDSIIRKCKAEMIRVVGRGVLEESGDGMSIGNYLGKAVELEVRQIKRLYPMLPFGVDMIQQTIINVIGAAHVLKNQRVRQVFFEYKQEIIAKGKLLPYD